MKKMSLLTSLLETGGGRPLRTYLKEPPSVVYTMRGTIEERAGAQAENRAKATANELFTPRTAKRHDLAKTLKTFNRPGASQATRKKPQAYRMFEGTDINTMLPRMRHLTENAD